MPFVKKTLKAAIQWVSTVDFRSSLNHKTFPVSVLNTIRQFAHDEIEAQTACQHALRQLS